MLMNKDKILDDEEKSKFARKFKVEDYESREAKIAKMLCKKGDELKHVKMREFKEYMEDRDVVDCCVRKLLSYRLPSKGGGGGNGGMGFV